MNFSNMSPSHRLKFFHKPLQCGSQILPANLLQCGLPVVSQFLLGNHLLQCGLLLVLQVGICSAINLQGLQGHSLSHHGLRHWLQGSLFSSA